MWKPNIKLKCFVGYLKDKSSFFVSSPCCTFKAFAYLLKIKSNCAYVLLRGTYKISIKEKFILHVVIQSKRKYALRVCVM